MTYAVIAVLLFVLITVLSVLGHSRTANDPRIRKLISLIDLAFGIIGLILVIAVQVFIGVRISAVSKDAVSTGASFASWATDMIGGWYSVALPAVGILLGIDILAAVLSRFDKKQQEKGSVFLRSAVLTVSSAVPLSLAPFYGFMTENSTVPLYSAILVSGIGMSLVFRAVSLIEYCRKVQKSEAK